MAGIDFTKFCNDGIDINYFSELFTTSGLVLNENIKWITFHGSYDLAYLMKALTNQNLPEDENIFNEDLYTYFCNFYDIRQLIKNISWLKGSLSRISSDLEVRRIGHTHQAGSDSLITSKVFFKLLTNYNDHIDLYTHRNKLYGFSYNESEWGYGYSKSFMSGSGIPSYMPHMGINQQQTTQGNSNMMNVVYFQGGFNGYQGNQMPVNPINNINMFYGNNNNMNNMNSIYHHQQMDFNYYGNFYNGNIQNNINSKYSVGGGFLNKESKFIPQA